MTKREKGAERRERLEAERKAQAAAARKRNLITAGIGILAGVVIFGGTAIAIISSEKDKPSNQPFSAFGVSAAAAKCDDVIVDPVSGASEHVGPGTNQPDTLKVDYVNVPPSSGQHFANWLDPGRHFYAPSDNPKVEQLVHNLEHGYNVVWYSPALADDKISALEGLADKISRNGKTRKFIVTPWSDAYGQFPKGKTIGMSHWGAKEGYRQLCGDVSGEAIAKFVEDHPASNSPEPNTP